MILTPVDWLILGVIGAFALYGAVHGARMQLRFLMGLYVTLTLTPVAVDKGLPPLLQAARLPADSLLLNSGLVAAAALISFCLGVVLFEKSPLNPGFGATPTPLDRLMGLALGGGKIAALIYAALCVLALYDVRAYRKATGLSASAALALAREHSFLSGVTPPRLDRDAARQRLEEEMRRVLAEIADMPQPSAASRELAEAIRRGDHAALSKDPRFAELLKAVGPLASPGARVDAAMSRIKDGR